MKSRTCYVLMPFKDEFAPIYREVYREVCRINQLKCARADDRYTPGLVTQEVVRGILSADVVIADHGAIARSQIYPHRIEPRPCGAAQYLDSVRDVFTEPVAFAKLVEHLRQPRVSINTGIRRPCGPRASQTAKDATKPTVNSL